MAESATFRTLQASPEHALVAAVKSGSVEAMGELARRHQSALRLFLRRMCRDPGEAEDQAQEAFIRAWQKISHLEQHEAFRPWLFTLALRRMRDAEKSRRRSAARDQDWSEISSAAQTYPSADNARLDVERALLSLAERERLIASLVYGAGLTHVEASRATGLPLGSVKTYAQRARAQLADLLSAWGDTGPGKEIE